MANAILVVKAQGSDPALKDRYFMEDVRESARLSRKVAADQSVTQYLTPFMPVEGEVLDVGCGPGALAMAAAMAHPNVSVTGIDLNATRYATALSRRPANLSFRQADALLLPFDSGSFDLVYSRFLLEYLPDKLQAVKEMARVVRPSAQVLLQDLDGQLLWHFPEDEELQLGITRVLDGLQKRGFDPFTGRKLFSLLKSAGLSNIRVSAESYHLYAGAIDETTLGLWRTKFDIVMPVAESILGSESAAAALRARFLAYLERDDTLTYSVVFTAVGLRRSD